MQIAGLKLMKGWNLLEIGTGRGGGLAYLTETLNPIVSYGLDISRGNIEFCRDKFADHKNINFVVGDAT